MHWSSYTGFMPFNEEHDLIFNNISGHMDLLDAGQAKQLLEVSWPLADDLQEYLASRGYLTDLSKEDEDRVFEETGMERFRNSQVNKKHIIIVTYDCNLRCTYCYEKHLRQNGEEWVQKRLTPEMVDQIYRVIDHYDNLGDDKSNNITLFGGEPLLPENREIVEYILQEGEKRGRQFTIVTNGTTLDQYVELITHYPVQTIQITIDGDRELHDQRRFAKDGSGTFDIIINNLRLLALHKEIQLDIKIALDRENRQAFQSLTQYLREMGLADQENIRAYIAPVFSDEHNPNYDRNIIMDDIFHFHQEQPREEIWANGLNRYHPLEEVVKTGVWLPKYAYCGAHQGMTFYDPFGDIYPCFESVGKPAYQIGRYIPALQWNSNYEKWRDRMILTLEKCRECKLALFCGGGCAYGTFQRFGTIEKENCSEMKLILEQYLPYLSRRYGNDSK